MNQGKDWIIDDGEFADRFGAVRMMKQFHDFMKPPFPYVITYAELLFKTYVDDDNKLALVLKVKGEIHGLLLASINPTELCPSYLVATERLWWISHEARQTGVGARAWRDMIRAYEEWAAGEGANLIQLTAYGQDDKADHRERVHKLYRRMQYAPAETHYFKLAPNPTR